MVSDGTVSGQDTGPIGVQQDVPVVASGTMIEGKYRVEERIGSGGMGVVYRVTRQTEGEEDTYAIKFMRPDLMASDEARARFRNEAKLAEQLRHPNIVAAYDHGTHGDLLFVRMEYVDGPSLRDVMDQFKKHGEPIRVDVALEIVGQVCGALAHAHEHTVHRDIKPANILLTGMVKDEEGLWRPRDDDWGAVRAKVTDFGIARAASPSEFGRTVHALGVITL